MKITTGCRLYFHGGNVETYGTAESPAIGSQTWGLTDHPISTMVKKLWKKCCTFAADNGRTME